MNKASSSRQTHLRFIWFSAIAISILVVTLGVAARNTRMTPPRLMELESQSTQQSGSTATPDNEWK